MTRRPLIAGLVLAAVFLVAFGMLAAGLVSSAGLIGLDSRVTSEVQELRRPSLTTVMVGITNAGDTPAVALAASALFVAFVAMGRRTEAAFAGGVVLTGGILSSLAKGSFARARPPVDQALIDLPLSFSFPSGHTMGSMALAFVMSYLIVRSSLRPATRVVLIAVCWLYAVLVGVSRVYLGVHWPSDVLAAWLLGGALAAFSVGLYEDRIAGTAVERNG